MSAIKIGFTGTQKGLTDKQRFRLSEYFKEYEKFVDWEFHDGDCIGADTEAHQLATACNAYLVGHPPSNPSKRGNNQYDFSFPELPYLQRNHRIVDKTDLLIACPGENYEVLRSGTWATIRYAKKKNAAVMIIYP